MDMSGLTLYFNQDEAAVRAVLAGNDILLKPSNGDAPIRGLREAVKSGKNYRRKNQRIGQKNSRVEI